jgi:RecB family exonuclease
LLPQLAALLVQREQLRSGTRGDLEAIDRRYRAFLDTHNLFEPNWELRGHVKIDHLPFRPVIVWPELLEDYPDYGHELEPLVEVVSLALDVPMEQADTTLREYRTTYDEIAATFDAIEDELETGTEAHELAITAANLDDIRPWLEEAAAQRGIPVRFATGSPVSEQPGGALFSRLNEVLQARFSVTAVASLLHDRSVPWRDPAMNAAIVRFGYETHCYDSRQWRSAIAEVQRLPEDKPRTRYLQAVSGKFGTLQTDISAIGSAADPSALRGAVRQFLDHHIAAPADAQWRHPSFERSERVYETALRELSAIVGLYERGIPVIDPWHFFLSAIGERKYVPRQAGGALPIYPYRVAAGIPVRRHYVLGLSQSATRIGRTPPIGLRSDDLHRLESLRTDRSPAFLNAYGAGLGNTVCSSSAETPAGAHVPAPELAFRSDSVVAPRRTAWTLEREWWAHAEAPPPTVLYAAQRVGLQRALTTALYPVTADFQREPVFPELLPLLHTEDEWSPTSIDRYNRCAFAYLVRKRLNVPEFSGAFAPHNPRQLGTVLHTILAAVFRDQSIREIDDPGDRIAEIVSAVFAMPEARLFLPRVGSAALERYVTAAVQLLVEDTRIGRTGPAGALETDLRGTVGGVTVTGRADRIIGDGETVTIIDYKTRLGSGHGPGRVLPEDEGEPRESSSLQLPIYALLYALDTGEPVDQLLYVDILNATVKVIAERNGGKKAAEAWDRLQRLVPKLPEYIAGIDRAVHAGDFRCDDEPNCGECGIRGICRMCFVTRRFTDGT